MNSEPKHESDSLDAILLESHHHVSDDGFTRRVLSSLPARQSKRSYRFPILTIAAVLCSIGALWLTQLLLNSPNWVSDQYAELGPQALGYGLAIVLGAAATVWGLWELVTNE
jgi:hypothetical protein